MKFKITIIGALVFTSVCIISCNSGSSNKSSSSADSLALSQKMADSIKAANNISTAGLKSNLELLQGKWQSTDDTSNYIVFDKDRRKEISEGMDNWEDEQFVISDKCLNDNDKANDVPAEKDKYISCAESDLCWYIVDLNATNLTLSYMGRGNTLSYKRVQ